jgi:membrane-associated phospholipid phosphatase
MNRVEIVSRNLVASAVVCAVVVALSFAYLDVPLARTLWHGSQLLKPLGGAFASIVLLSGEGAVVLALGVTRLVRGRLSPLAATLALACATSMLVYLINDHVLKILCGVANPLEVLHGVRHSFRYGLGTAGSSFPSGHMVMASGFAGVFMSRYKASIRPLAALLLAGAALLLGGDWHFLSDVVAGGFIGLWAGLMVGAARAHR